MKNDDSDRGLRDFFSSSTRKNARAPVGTPVIITKKDHPYKGKPGKITYSDTGGGTFLPRYEASLGKGQNSGPLDPRDFKTEKEYQRQGYRDIHDKLSRKK